jgi:hypothetical protein
MLRLIIFGLFLSVSLQLASQTPSKLFEDTTMLVFNLKMDINGVTQDVVDRDDHAGILSYVDETGETISIDLKIKTRGKTRANPEVCRFPPIQLNFKKHENAGNLFEEQDKLKLVVHCQNSKAFDQYVLQEYITYKHYNILTPNSFKVRLAKVNYIDTEGKNETISRYAMLIEDIEDLAKRQKMIVGGEVHNQDNCDVEAIDIFTIFQYMIGNTDWSVTEQHNVKLISNDSNDKHPIPIAYDFDYSGSIKTYYATPPESLPIENVRTRIFRGYCRIGGHYEKVFELFLDKKEEIDLLYQSFTRMDEKRVSSTLKYFDEFYKILGNPKKSGREIVRACTIPHSHRY